MVCVRVYQQSSKTVPPRGYSRLYLYQGKLQGKQKKSVYLSVCLLFKMVPLLLELFK